MVVKREVVRKVEGMAVEKMVVVEKEMGVKMEVVKGVKGVKEVGNMVRVEVEIKEGMDTLK